jgi:F0F1-type ATP synthase assembly protein I
MSEQERRPESDGRDFADAAWSVPSYLLSGILVWGGLGWLLDRWTGVYAFIPIGVILGAVLAVYLVYLKYGR